tara:strand:+ start:12874 stop:13092 length:219 start_codon:yes stop_codon:yes gene_type:complete
MNNKIYANMATHRYQQLVKLLGQIENVDRQRMSNSSQIWLDEIWSLLGLPTYEENQKLIRESAEHLKSDEEE